MASALRQTIQALPGHVGITDLRLLIPAMGELAQDRPLNQLAAEAVAAAAFLETAIEVEIDVPQIRDAASAEQVEYRVIS